MLRLSSSYLKYLLVILLTVVTGFTVLAAGDDFPPKPNVIRPVNDLGEMLEPNERAQLDAQLIEYEKTSSTEIIIVTVKSIGSYDIEQYAVELGNKWQIGKKGKNNGVVILVSRDERKINISTGYGLEGALPDVVCGRIIRNEMAPNFKLGSFYEGFKQAADAVIAATKGEYKADEKIKGKRVNTAAIIVVIIIIIIIIISKRGGGGSFMSGRGYRNWGGGPWIGGGFGGFGGGSWGGGGSSGSGGFGGFGSGGGFGGGGASGGW